MYARMSVPLAFTRRCGAPRGTTIRSPRTQRHALIAERVLHLAVQHVDHLFAVGMRVLDIALARGERRQPHRHLRARRVARARCHVHRAEVGRLRRRAHVAADLPVDRGDVHEVGSSQAPRRSMRPARASVWRLCSAATAPFTIT
jgi:hypothetical protein